MSIQRSAIQRAIIFQGGGALGAFEAGVYDWLSNKLGTSTDISRPLFDIYAGTSIGAVNAAILVSHFLEEGKWKGGSEKLKEFWKYVSTDSLVDLMPGFEEGWNFGHLVNPMIATGQEARSYYSVKQFVTAGVPNVFSPVAPILDPKFLDDSPDPSGNIRFWYDNSPLRRSIEKFAHFPIKTSVESGQPRLLLTSVDVLEGETVTFDSYPKPDGTRKSQYGTREDSKSFSGKPEYEYTIEYPDGITIDQVMASASVPINFDYTVLEAKRTSTAEISKRHFWDGGLLSNTPLREVVSQHKLFWENQLQLDGSLDEILGMKPGKRVPDLEAYIANVWPTRTDDVPIDKYSMNARKKEIVYGDKTPYDEKVANIVTDYIDLCKGLIDTALNRAGNPAERKATEDAINNILDKKARTKSRLGERRTYRELLKGRFSIAKSVRVELAEEVREIVEF